MFYIITASPRRPFSLRFLFFNCTMNTSGAGIFKQSIGARNRGGIGYRTGPPGWQNAFLGIDSGLHKRSKIRAGTFEHPMEAMNWVGIRLSYRPARLHRLAESITWNRFLGSLKVKNTGSVFTHVNRSKISFFLCITEEMRGRVAGWWG